MILSAEDVSVKFHKGFRRTPIKALDGLTLAVRDGDFLALIGENGAGKSTAMYSFLGLIRPNRGKVLLFGERPRPGSSLYGRIGYLPEEPHYHLYLTVVEAVAYYASLSDARVSSEQIRQILERLGLAEFRDLRLSKCSKGMKQKVGIAQCLLHAPSLLFLDEPMRGLDPIIVREFRQILADLHRDGVTIVMNSHMLPEVEALATRVAVLDKGKVVADDTIDNFRRVTSDVYLVEFEAARASFRSSSLSRPRRMARSAARSRPRHFTPSTTTPGRGTLRPLLRSEEAEPRRLFRLDRAEGRDRCSISSARTWARI